MKTKCLILLVVLITNAANCLHAHEKYAILISGDRPDHVWVNENVCDVDPTMPLDWQIWLGSWNDTYLMWEMLVVNRQRKVYQ
jgi:hypothetical protein